MLYKCYILVGLFFLKVLMLIRQVHLRNALLVTIGTFLGKRFGFQPTVCKECHVWMLFFDINNITALKM